MKILFFLIIKKLLILLKNPKFVLKSLLNFRIKIFIINLYNQGVDLMV